MASITVELGERYLPLYWRKFFAPPRAAPKPDPDPALNDGGIWFGDELPPSYQDFLKSMGYG